MAVKLERTSTPGVFRRHTKSCDRNGRCDCSYVIVYLVDGAQQTETYGTLADAREAKRAAARRARLSKAHVGGLHGDEPRRECPECEHELAQRERHDPTLHLYAREWVERYTGTGRRGFREETRDEHRRLLERYILRYFESGARVSQIDPRAVADFVNWLTRQPSRRGGTLSDKSVRNVLGVLSTCLATARREGLIAHNPAADAVLPHRPRIEDDEERARPFPRIAQDGETLETMELVVQLVHPDHRLMFELLAATGVRRSELLALELRHLHPDGESPHVSVRQRVRRRRRKGLVIGPLKSRHSRRDLPIPTKLAERLAAHARGRGSRELLFASNAGTVLDPDNLAERVLAPACEEAGVEWAGFHTFRHTVASRLFAEDRNVVQVQRWLGHHAPSFTLDTYVHLLEGDLGAPLEAARVNVRSTEGPEKAANDARGELAETAN